MVFLHAHGVSTSRAVRIFKTYGQDAIAVVQENPYRLARDIRGIGFLSADTIAQKVGIAKDSPLRAQAGISYALTEASAKGHCGLPYAELVPLAVEAARHPRRRSSKRAIAQEIADEVLVADTVDGSPASSWRRCTTPSARSPTQIKRLKTGAPTWPAFDADKAIPWVEQKLAIAAGRQPEGGHPPGADLQAAGHHRRPRRRQDDPGQFHPDHPARQGVKPLLCAPTGRAAKRLSESTGLEAKTIHRLLEVNPANGQFKRNAGLTAGLRSAGRRRVFDDRRAAGQPAAQGRAQPRRGDLRRRRGSAALGRARASSWPT